MVNRPAGAAEPDDSGHFVRLVDAGAVAYRGTATISGRGRVSVRHEDVTHELATEHVVVAVGSVTKQPPIEGIDRIPTWTNREATLARELPASLLVLGGGPTGVRARAGLCQVRRADDDRAVRAATGPDRSSAQLRGRAGRPSNVTG